MSVNWQTVKLGSVLVEQRQRVGRADAEGLPLLGVSNQLGLHCSVMPRHKRYEPLSSCGGKLVCIQSDAD